ncbi:HNH endonuclease [Dermabacter sp.]|uniref:HNH endonuclease n=1 Tax=Dermabacter sp. TaxID=37640 RepID=UPI0037C09A13
MLPLSRGGSHDFTNLMALCKPRHSRISALDGDLAGSGNISLQVALEPLGHARIVNVP